MSQFSSNETVSLEKQIENGISSITKTKPEDLNQVYEIERCLEWIKGSNYKKVCLQFPDHLLPDSTQIALALESRLQQTVYVMADTAYESCCVDYVAAAHVNADAIIHFGQTCFSKQAEKVPCLRIYEKSEVNTEKLIEVLCTKFASEKMDQVLIVLDGPYLWKKRALEAVYKVKGIDEDDLDFGEEFKTVFITDNLIKAMNFEFRVSPKELFVCNPQQTPLKIVNYNQDMKILKRRYFLAEKIKDSLTVGIIIGTLAVSNYLEALERVKTLLKLHKKKYYIISVGKPTVAKLANFPEIDLYVLISCAMNETYESRDFYKPIVTPYDVESALNPQVTDLKFSYDYNTILNQSQLDPNLESKLPENDVSLLTGNIRSRLDFKPEDESKELATKPDGTLALNNSHGAGFLASKSWRGLEQNLGENEPEIAEEGRRGIASGYQNEKT